MYRTLFAGATALLLAGSLPAAACTVVHELSYRLSGNDYSIAMNGVFLSREDGGNGGRSLMIYLVPGENTVTVTQHDPNGTAELQIMKGCEGTFDRQGPFDTATISGEGSATLTFTNESDFKSVQNRASAEGQDGLMDAVKELQAAVEAKDVETVIALHAPMIEDAAKMGMPVEQLQGMYTFLFDEGVPDMKSDLTITEALDGRVFVVTTADGQPPVSVYAAAEGIRWHSGVHWGKVDGKWGVLNLYQ
ncbi:MAG: hypothetical protein AAGC81_15405 [Pseudomonadota bacterium]